MEKKYYEINGESLSLRDICNKYEVSRATFLRKIEKGLPVEEAVKKNTTYKDYKAVYKKREVNWPADIATDILESCGIDILKETGKFNLDDIITNFDKRINLLYEENKLSFKKTEKEIINKYYKEGLTIVEIAKDYEITKQRVSTIINTYLKKFKKRVFLKYLLEDLENMPYIHI